MTIDDDTAGQASLVPDGHALPKTGDVIARYRIVKLLGRGIAHEQRRSDGLAVVDEARLMPVLMSGAASEPTSAARALAAHWVVAGAYQVAGGRVRISCTVTDGATGNATPCERIDGGLDEIFDLQDRLVAELRHLLGSSRRGTTSKEVKLAPETYEAYEWYARAQLALQHLTAEASVEAEQCLKNAFARDPDRDDPRFVAARARADHHTALLVASLKSAPQP